MQLIAVKVQGAAPRYVGPFNSPEVAQEWLEENAQVYEGQLVEQGYLQQGQKPRYEIEDIQPPPGAPGPLPESAPQAIARSLNEDGDPTQWSLRLYDPETPGVQVAMSLYRGTEVLLVATLKLREEGEPPYVARADSYKIPKGPTIEIVQDLWQEWRHYQGHGRPIRLKTEKIEALLDRYWPRWREWDEGGQDVPEQPQ